MQFGKILRLGLPVLLAAALGLAGCGVLGYTTVKQWAGYRTGDEEGEETAPPEAQQETVMIDGKPYVRSKNPYWLTEPQAPEYLYVEKGTEFVGAQQYLIKLPGQGRRACNRPRPRARRSRRISSRKWCGPKWTASSRSRGWEALSPRARREPRPWSAGPWRSSPTWIRPKATDGLNRTLAMAVGSALGKTKDLKVSSPESVQEALRKAAVAGKLTLAPNIKALGDALGVQGIVLTGIMPPEGGTQGAMVMQVYDTFTGLQEDAIVAPAAAGGVKPDSVNKFAQDNYLRVAGNLSRIAWFGRVEFVKEGKVYLSLGQNSGLKVGDRLKVVEPGKEVVNPKTHSVLGYTADVPQGEVKVTELLGNSGAVAMALNGGPFKANDKVKPAK